jgi:hypothetical protein
MDRKEFLKNCACGLCTCAAIGVIPPEALTAAENAKAEDWRLPFVKKRYGKLLEILSSRMDEKTLNETLHELGTFCSSLGDEWIEKFRGDFDGFCKSIKQSLSGDTVTYDREKGIITMDSGERTDCFCPLIGRLYNTPKVACNCSLGWQQHTWETLLGKKVQVELKESVLRGGKRCLFEIRVGDVAPAKATS